jgi:hypothetical protein
LTILFLWALLSALALAQDRQLISDPNQELYGSSSFARGYLHGYEWGYHDGDLDLQLAHEVQDPAKMKDYGGAKRAFKKSFGDRDAFIKGYQYGFRVGYGDAIKGLRFRAVDNLRELAQDLPPVNRESAPILDQAIVRGYLDGVRSGLHDGRSRKADYRPDRSDCQLALRFQKPPAQFYCSAYSVGYRLGYADGFHNQRPIPEPRRMAGEE